MTDLRFAVTVHGLDPADEGETWTRETVQATLADRLSRLVGLDITVEPAT